QHRGLMVRNVGVEGPDPTDTIRAFADLREQFAHLHAAFAVLLEGELRAHQRAGLPLSLNGRARQRLAVIPVEHRLGIEAIHLRKSAVHEKEDDMLRARGSPFRIWFAAWTAASRLQKALRFSCRGRRMWRVASPESARRPSVADWPSSKAGLPSPCRNSPG